jgi:hypothetical protein
MECNNNHCMWNFRGQCCPESEEQYNNAKPNQLDCPSSLREDFQSQLYSLVDECFELLKHRNMKELIEVKKFIESQRVGV